MGAVLTVVRASSFSEFLAVSVRHSTSAKHRGTHGPGEHTAKWRRGRKKKKTPKPQEAKRQLFIYSLPRTALWGIALQPPPDPWCQARAGSNPSAPSLRWGPAGGRPLAPPGLAPPRAAAAIAANEGRGRHGAASRGGRQDGEGLGDVRRDLGRYRRGPGAGGGRLGRPGRLWQGAWRLEEDLGSPRGAGLEHGSTRGGAAKGRGVPAGRAGPGGRGRLRGSRVPPVLEGLPAPLGAALLLPRCAPVRK